ncbi:MAG: hypothetical protein JJU33_12820 [Phycisphaerales bacterium]|nr:hypothetical protein [Phycisphaerales bacterium]
MPLTKGNLTLTDAEVEAAIAAKNISLGEGKPGDLERVVALASSTSELERRVAEDLLAYLALDFPEARQKIEDLSDSPRYAERMTALAASHRAHPDGLRERLLKKALTDRSKRVRDYALWIVIGLRDHAWLATLEEARDSATDPAIAEELDKARRLIRDGYRADPDPDGGYQVVFYSFIDYGTLGTGYGYRTLSKDEVEESGLDAAVKALLEEKRELAAEWGTSLRSTRKLDIDYWWEIGEGRRAAIHKMLRAVDDRDPGPPDRARFEARKAATRATDLGSERSV